MNPFCSLWSTENATWKTADWKWKECRTVTSSCAVWKTTDILWKLANWRWKECSGSIIPPGPPILGGNLPGIDATVLIQPWLRVDEEPWNPYKLNQCKLIRLICKTSDERYSEEKKKKDMGVNVRNIKVKLDEATDIKLNIKV